jgi:hypothetical protein
VNEIPQGALRPTPTPSTCLYYYHDNEASQCEWNQQRAEASRTTQSKQNIKPNSRQVYSRQEVRVKGRQDNE